MNRFRGPSRATPQTLCQKCLKKDDYECQAAAQQRPYVSRPSRTQQLANPTLRPKLNSDVPNDLLRRKGVADEQLEKIEHDRKRKPDIDDPIHGANKRSRSVSSHSSSSVLTISTNLSRSPSPSQAMSYNMSQAHDTFNVSGKYKMRRSRDSSMSYSSEASYKRHRKAGSNGRDRDFPKKLSSVGGLEGERNGKPGPGKPVASARKRRRSRSSSMSYTSNSSSNGRRRSKAVDDIRRTRPRRSTVSPDTRGRDRWSRAPRNSRRTPSRTNSMDRSQIARERRSMTPDSVSGEDRDKPAKAGSGKKAVMNRRLGRDNNRHGSSFRNQAYEDGRAERPRPAPPLRKERSLSPFSKRVALTQAMNMGR
ncbi:MAG: hypothetical protein Q9209_000164 [Squamulea sp. 1 TL-2023]